MSVVFLDNHDCVRFGALRFWAERGLIHVEDSRDGSYQSISVRSTLKRMDALSDMLKNERERMRKEKIMDSAAYDRVKRMLDNMIEVCRKAQIQGMPDDPSARADLKRRRPVTVVVPDVNSVL